MESISWMYRNEAAQDQFNYLLILQEPQSLCQSLYPNYGRVCVPKLIRSFATSANEGKAILKNDSKEQIKTLGKIYQTFWSGNLAMNIIKESLPK
ncbi:hypothetical protein NPIL_123291 [Nephila pilipes]|uniref:Uncharacterized protein n=1 Tax=Nephila pilipes TaxID=299642 RepID=A0A8X6JQB8_NEPPI|nr:hypothetical protein NPIL_123291 [Nephila pilipes]